MGSHGHLVDFDAAHSQATKFNELARLGTVGIVFHACCLLETTTNAFHIRMMPSAPPPARYRLVSVSISPDLRRPAESVPISTGRCCFEDKPPGRGADIISQGTVLLRRFAAS